jgi:hypothetical protein
MSQPRAAPWPDSIPSGQGMTTMHLTTAQIESINAAENEKCQVFSWRFDELRRAGYAFQDALVLAISDSVDLHLAIDLPARGCPHTTALRILA